MKTINNLASALLLLALFTTQVWADENTDTIKIFRNAIESKG